MSIVRRAATEMGMFRAERIPAHDEIAGCRDLERQDPRYAITGRPRSKSANPANNLMAIRMSWSACAQTRALLTD
jgi:hypothetical protein